MVDEQLTGHQVGRYELLEALEEGMAGHLYRARDTESGRPVLLKLVAQSVSGNPAFGRYFYDKWADRQALIEHPNVLEVIEVSKHAGRYFVAVEEAGGTRLKEKLQQAPLDPDEALEIVHQIAEGLRAAHRRNVVHGHLKPSDIILSTDPAGRPLVKVAFLDLGVLAGDSVVSLFGEMVGAPKYMPPEVIQGRAPDPQADVFALGVIAYELLTGREPFPSEHPLGYLSANCQQEPVPADAAREGLPREIALVLSRMLEKGRGKRYRAMQRVIDDLGRCVQSIKTGHVEVVPHGTDSAFARGYQLPEPTRAPSRGLPSVVWMAVLLVLAAAVGVLGYQMGRSRAGAAPPPSPGPPSGAVVGAPGREGPGAPARAVPAPSATHQSAAAEAFDKAAAAWRRYSADDDYELGLAAFQEVARKHGDTPFASRSREMMARIWTEWGRARAAKGDPEGAVQKYEKAIEVAPKGSEFAALARRSLPAAMVELA
ncbi:MAG: protein kinase domain-containing protein, partial [Planctomycetota bacterium]